MSFGLGMGFGDGLGADAGGGKMDEEAKGAVCMKRGCTAGGDPLVVVTDW